MNICLSCYCDLKAPIVLECLCGRCGLYFVRYGKLPDKDNTDDIAILESWSYLLS